MRGRRRDKQTEASVDTLQTQLPFNTALSTAAHLSLHASVSLTCTDAWNRHLAKVVRTVSGRLGHTVPRTWGARRRVCVCGGGWGVCVFVCVCDGIRNMLPEDVCVRVCVCVCARV